MQSFANIFGFGARDDEPPPSVLAEWQKYSGESSDQVQDGVVQNMEEGTAAVRSFLSNSFKNVSSNVQGASATITSISSAKFTVPSRTQFVYFFALLGAGVFFLILAFSLFLPMIILAPAKFAFSFSLGSACILAAFASLKGWQQQLIHMASAERLPFSIGYVGSIFATLYSALVMHSYVFSLICCAMQVMALMYYVLSYFPGGAAGAKFVLTMFYQASMNCLMGVQKAIFK